MATKEPFASSDTGDPISRDLLDATTAFIREVNTGQVELQRKKEELRKKREPVEKKLRLSEGAVKFLSDQILNKEKELAKLRAEQTRVRAAVAETQSQLAQIVQPIEDASRSDAISKFRRQMVRTFLESNDPDEIAFTASLGLVVPRSMLLARQPEFELSDEVLEEVEGERTRIKESMLLLGRGVGKPFLYWDERNAVAVMGRYDTVERITDITHQQFYWKVLHDNPDYTFVRARVGNADAFQVPEVIIPVQSAILGTPEMVDSNFDSFNIANREVLSFGLTSNLRMAERIVGHPI